VIDRLGKRLVRSRAKHAAARRAPQAHVPCHFARAHRCAHGGSGHGSPQPLKPEGHRVVPAPLFLALIQAASRDTAVVTATVVERWGRTRADSIWRAFAPTPFRGLRGRGQGTLLSLARPLPQVSAIADSRAAAGSRRPDPCAASTHGVDGPVRRAGRGRRLDGSLARGLPTPRPFHVFQTASKKEGKRFGRGENSFLARVIVSIRE